MSALKVCPQCGTEYELDMRFCPNDGSTLRMENPAGDLVGAIVADRYHVLRKLGEGGMGQVYLAEHVKMGRKSAVKVMNPSMVKDADAVSRFNREAANASRITHPNVAAVYDFGETGEGLIYLAMEYIDGPPLTALIEQQGALPPVRAAEITRQAAEALAVAHDMGIVHRDLKPDNIMIARARDGGDLVKVVDFGIAKAADNAAQKVTKTGLVVGTPEYMSPEQLAGDKLDGRSDIYSLGLVAYNMLTGTLPFPSDSLQETMIMRLTDRAKPLSEMKPDVAWPDGVQAVMDRVLERAADARYQSATEFARDLSRAIATMPDAQSMEAGTLVLSRTTPRTSAAAAVTEAMPATRVRARTPSTGMDGELPATLATPARRSPMPWFAGGALALSAIATVLVLMKGDGTAGPAGGSDSVPTMQTGAAGADSGVPLSAPLGTRGGQPSASTSPPAPPGGGATAERALVSEIERLEGLQEAASEPASARTLLQQTMRLEPVTDSSRVRVAILRFGLAQLAEEKADPEAGCTALREVSLIAPGTRYARTFQERLAFCSPPLVPTP